MGASPRVRRVVLLGAGMGLGLALLEAGAPRGWVGGFTALVSLVPMAVALALGGVPAAVLAIAAGLAGGLALAGGAAMAVVGLKHLLPGLALGWSLVRRLSLAASLALVSGASLLGLVVLVWTLVPGGSSPLMLFERQLDAHVAELEDLPGRLGSRGDPGWAAETARALASIMRVAGPGVVLVGLLLVSLMNYVVARLCLRRRDGFRPFAEETVPDHLVWAVIAAGLLLVSGQDGLERVGLNLLILLAPFYALQGFAVLRHLSLRLGLPRPLQVVGFGLFVLQPLLLLGSAGLGLADLWVDFRKIRRTPASA